MLMLDALRHRSIALLWSGQALSSIGDEICRVALIWLAVGLIGEDVGYMAAGQFAAVLILSIIGGGWADRWDHLRTMITVDLLRAVIVLIPVVTLQFMPIGLPVLFGVALMLSGLQAFFDPALQASLPRFSPNPRILKAATGLMGTTMRLARVAGPGVIGFLTPVIPMIHFFTIDALTFVMSALSIMAIRAPRIQAGQTSLRLTFIQSITRGLRVLKNDSNTAFIMVAKALISGFWTLGYSLGFTFLVRQIAPNDVRAFGLVIASYGAGNLGGALIFGNMKRRKPLMMMYFGYAWLGVGFLWAAQAQTLTNLFFASAFTAIAGPLNDLPFMDLIQERFAVKDLAMIFRLRMALDTTAMLVSMLAAPTLLKLLPVSEVIMICGLAYIVIAAVGVLRFRESH